MKRQVYNPYLPLYEYIPDGEPHVFNGRVYIYGSHDKFGAFNFCQNNYVTWSAPIQDLTNWKYEGEIYNKREDPDNKNGRHNLFAPDVTCGPDGKYYLYYTLDWTGKIGVAKADNPVGPFKFIGHVKYNDGTELGRKKEDAFQFDPAVLTDDNGKVYLYSGFGATTWFPQIRHHLKPQGCFCMELDNDMRTIKKGPIKVLDKKGKAFRDEFQGHNFFEASSIRKIKGFYYLVYSSVYGHDLCYCTSHNPFGPFYYQGVIVDIGDIGFENRLPRRAIYPLGNNHGGIATINGQYYIFYHRHTNYTNTDRQGMADKIVIDQHGTIKQVETTSCGLNHGSLSGCGDYPASICCILVPHNGNIFYPFFALPFQKKRVYITQSGKDSDKIETQYIHNLRSLDKFGYRFFNLSHTTEIALTVSGNAKGTFEVFALTKSLGKTDFISTKKSKSKIVFTIKTQSFNEELLFSFKGKGKLDVFTVSLK